MTGPRLLQIFLDLTELDPDAAVLMDGAAGHGPVRTLDRRALHDLTAAVAHDFKAQGVGAGDCIGVWLPNWSHAVAAQLAAAAVGAQVVGVNTRYNVDEVAHVLTLARPKAVLIAHDFRGLGLRERFHAACSAAGVAAPFAFVVGAPGAGVPGAPEVAAYDAGGGAALLCSRSANADLLDVPSVSALMTAFTTSGSTGRSKLPAHDDRGMTEHLLAVADHLDLDSGSVMLGALPLSGVFGFSACMAAVVGGGAVLLEPVFEADGVLADMAATGVTHIVAADDLVGRLAEAWRVARPQLALRCLGIADFEGHSRDLAAWAEADLGATVMGVYGSSELMALAAIWPADAPDERRWGGGGRLVLGGTEVRVVDPSTGQVVNDGEDGELQFRGPSVVDSYLGDDGATMASAFTDDGFFRTGDLGRKVAHRTLEFVCRMGDVLRLRGFLVDPAEIEVRLVAHPQVRRAKVVGIPGPSGDTQAVAFVELETAATTSATDLQAWCAEALARFKVPHSVRFLDALPTTSGTNGTKVRTAELREIALKERHAHA